ncbi:hypothetical protein EV380_1828 [Zhihengliuella halotolerans]|uniref:Uncharacterized protein n=1 Tax=Zhihengliuella halotolerans TaxID=370736 RepID=A0A4Q8AET8_9MICC|nr:hypothetical protein EV380_1828 [Zhihengliuella halotolerans]
MSDDSDTSTTLLDAFEASCDDTSSSKQAQSEPIEDGT